MQGKLHLVLASLLVVLVAQLEAVSLGSEAAFQEILNKHKQHLDGVSSIDADLGDASLSVPEIIAKYGYPIEIHYVTTDDGYILQLHRVPYGRNCGPAAGKKVVWLQHGLLGDSSNYVIAGVDKSLAYLLADACYDVWLGNARGNTYSKNHTTLPTGSNSVDYWAFSWNEMGRFDLPANFDYVLGLTGADGLYYAGHSMGTTMFFVCMSERPEYNSKIKLMSALAPVSFTQHMISPIALIAPFEQSLEWLLRMIGANEFLPSSEFMEFIGRTVCHSQSPIQAVCSNVLFLIMGYNFDQMDPELLPVLMGHMPAGSSARNLVHYAQGVNSGKFRKYDYGTKARNREAYGQDTPPDYDISKITAPVALYWGENDWLGVKSDVYRLAELLPNIQRKYRMAHDKFNHVDFLTAIDINPLLNKPLMDFMEYF